MITTITPGPCVRASQITRPKLQDIGGTPADQRRRADGIRLADQLNTITSYAEAADLQEAHEYVASWSAVWQSRQGIWTITKQASVISETEVKRMRELGVITSMAIVGSGDEQGIVVRLRPLFTAV